MPALRVLLALIIGVLNAGLYFTALFMATFHIDVFDPEFDFKIMDLIPIWSTISFFTAIFVAPLALPFLIYALSKKITRLPYYLISAAICTLPSFIVFDFARLGYTTSLAIYLGILAVAWLNALIIRAIILPRTRQSKTPAA